MGKQAVGAKPWSGMAAMPGGAPEKSEWRERNKQEGDTIPPPSEGSPHPQLQAVQQGAGVGKGRGKNWVLPPGLPQPPAPSGHTPNSSRGTRLTPSRDPCSRLVQRRPRPGPREAGPSLHLQVWLCPCSWPGGPSGSPTAVGLAAAMSPWEEEEEPAQGGHRHPEEPPSLQPGTRLLCPPLAEGGSPAWGWGGGRWSSESAGASRRRAAGALTGSPGTGPPGPGGSPGTGRAGGAWRWRPRS